jgi:glycosyltransferase involved in cell wall biosynthesis
VKILLTQRSSIELYPPGLHQAHLLTRLGDVSILDYLSNGGSSRVQTDVTIRRVRVDAAAFPARSAYNALFAGLFMARLSSMLLTERPDVMIAYDHEASAAMLALARSKRTMRIVHLHELPMAELCTESVLGSAAMRYLIANLSNADLLIVPDSDRAGLIERWSKRTGPTAVVMNCPARLERLPESRLLPYLKSRGIPTSAIVHYQGSVGLDHCIDKAIKSMVYWPPDAVLVLVGAAKAQEERALREIAADVGVAHRIVWIGRVPYDEVFSYAVGAHVGLSLLAPTTLNWKYAAGASNKRFEYVALGIPQVTNIGPGIDNLFVSTGLARAVRENDVRAIGVAVAGYLTEPVDRLRVYARETHLASYNYETQFEPVLERIARWKPRAPRSAS